MSEKLVLIDGHSILFRAFYGMPLGMTAPDGTHTNAVYGFLAILHKVIEEEKPDYLAVAFDLAAPTFRHKLYPAYKGTRQKAPEEFHEQVPVMKKLLTDMEIPVLTAEGWEADDILGTLARDAEMKGVGVSLISGDRDLLQIASAGTEIVIPKTRGGKTTYERYTPEIVKKTYGVTPEAFIELKALMGDTSDNVPGLPGVGPKTAQKIMETFGSIENAHNHVDEVKPPRASKAMKENWDQLLLSLDLVTIRTNAPVHFDEEAMRLGNPYNEKSYEDFKRLGFTSLLGRFDMNRAPKAPEFSFEEVSDLAEMASSFEKAAHEKKIGVSLLEEDGKIYAAGLADGRSVRVFRTRGFITEADLLRYLGEAVSHAGQTACMNVKALLRHFPEIQSTGNLFDAVVAAYLTDPLKSDWAYDSIASAFLKRTVPSEEELIGKKGLAAAYADGKDEEISRLAAYMAAVALDSAGPLTQKLSALGMEKLFTDVEMPLTRTLASMENEGIICRRDELAKYGASLTARIDELTDLIYSEAGEEFNINSPKQLGNILFEKMHLTGGKKTKTGYSTAADVLEKLAPDYPIVANVLEYRTLAKLKSTYADGLAAFIKEDGKIHTTFNQTITATGRLSSADPNLQNIPMREELGRLIRKCFYPAEGCVFVDADYSQIELRILAHMSGDEKLIEAYREAKDIHRITASQVFHTPFDEVTDLQRRNAKAVNFGIVYGISSFGLSQGLSISRREAQEYINQYFKTYPKIKTFLDGLIESAKEKGYAVSLFGRIRPIPELKSKNYMQRSFGERAAMNSPIQGTAADIMKIAMNRVYARLRREVPEARLILQIHDELLVEAPVGKAEQVQTILTEEMKHAADLKVTLETDCHIGRNWYEAK
ncbi:MAG: DNA polymerase I [Lachnospiraceae bacterium]|jgi:DNA polymerase-1|nr:DNA polymerase I [Lachnospiraceae bacterium]MCH4064698.1 DNA polymerase I [Lachnospiraceae bacterium]MCH4104930.1 DNA polymerase I [Lachnospiraceae bacterium]MCI1308342.1 DNA polymerase I [Lachnospiraceae bacterium]MCI1332867.1 DNA polymerase I [Lachnospiraceae bacterium]